MLVTFIYKLNNEPKMYFGKMIDDITDDYDEGLDVYIKEVLSPYYKGDTVMVGIMSAIRYNHDEFYSENEYTVFDFYYDYGKVYINQKPV
jgi:hypothetical protein